jgi:hypothetical protein
MSLSYEIFVRDDVQTVGAEVKSFGGFGILENSAVVADISIIALRADGVAKAWTFQTFIRRGTGLPSIVETIPPTLNQFATAGDETTLTGVSIAALIDYSDMRIQITGIAGSTLNWKASVEGSGLTL